MVTLPESNMFYAAKRCAFHPMHPNRSAAALTLVRTDLLLSLSVCVVCCDSTTSPAPSKHSQVRPVALKPQLVCLPSARLQERGTHDGIAIYLFFSPYFYSPSSFATMLVKKRGGAPSTAEAVKEKKKKTRRSLARGTTTNQQPRETTNRPPTNQTCCGRNPRF